MGNEAIPEKNFVELSLSELRELIGYDEADLIDAHQREMIEGGLPELYEDSFIPEAETDEQRGRFLLLCINRELYDDEVEDFIDGDPVVQALLQEKQKQLEHAHARAFRARRSIVALLFETAKTLPDSYNIGKAA